MPALRELRQERFCLEFIKTGVAAKAYVKAGYTASTRNSLDACSSRLLGNAKIAQRIEELRQRMAQKHAVTLDTLADELDEARNLAIKTEQPSAAVQATTVKAKLFGHLVDRKEVGKPGDFNEMISADDVLAQVRKELGDDAAAALGRAIGSDEPAPKPVAQDLDTLEPTHDAPGVPQ